MTTVTYGPALTKMLKAFPHAHQASSGWWRNEDDPRFDFIEQENGSITIHPWTGRSVEEILALGGLTTADIHPKGYFRVKVKDTLNLVELGQAKKIDWRFLLNLGLRDGYKFKGRNCVMIPYFLADGSQHTRIRVRKAISGDYKHAWDSSAHTIDDHSTPGNTIPYGLNKLDMARQAGYMTIGEGESDAWACWYHDVPYLGIPGATSHRCLQGIDFNDIPKIYILQEPDQVRKLLSDGQGFYRHVHQELRAGGYRGEILYVDFEQATGCKDASELHLKLWGQDQARGFQELFMQALINAAPANDDDSTAQGIIALDQAIAQKDARAILRAVPVLAELPQLTYMDYRIQIKDACGTAISLSELDKVVKEARRANAAAQDDGRLYAKTEKGMLYLGDRSYPVELSNFTASIVADVITDDGAERTRSYELEAELYDRQIPVFEVVAKDFAKCEWVDEHLGARAQITTGQSMKSHVINAIKSCSEPIERFNYAHTGWREIDGKQVFLHAGGALGHSDIHAQVKLAGTLGLYSFPAKRGQVQDAIRASLKFLELTSDEITMPLYAALWRAPLGGIDFALHLAGQSGLGKTELAALVQQHYGAGMSAHHLPGSWESTDNSLEMLFFQAKDVVVVADDFKPKGGKTEQDRLHGKADRTFRTIGNGSARGRLSSNLEQRPTRTPRCLLLSTGEDIPRGQSLKARGCVLTMTESITTGQAARRLSAAQMDAQSGLYAQAMAAYIEWLAPRITAIQAELTARIGAEREQLSIAGHARSATNTANLLIGMKSFLQFACETGALTEEEADTYMARCVSALLAIAEAAALENAQDKPSEQWKQLVVAALDSKRAHLVGPNGEMPGTEYGWIRIPRSVERDGVLTEEETFHPGGDQIGWIDGEDIYLLPAVAYKVARVIASQANNDITTLEPTLRKFLAQDGLLASTDLGRARNTITVRRRLEKLQRDVLHLAKETLYPENPPASPHDTGPSEDAPNEAAAKVKHAQTNAALQVLPRPSQQEAHRSAEAWRFYRTFCARPGHTLRMREDGQVAIGVPGDMSDEDFSGIAQQVSALGEALIRVLQQMNQHSDKQEDHAS